MDSARKPLHTRRFLLSLGLLTALALTGCDLYAPKKKDAQPQSQTDTKKEAPESPDAEAGLEEGAPPTTPEPPSGSAPSMTAPSGEGNQPENPTASSPGGQTPPPGQTPPGETPPPSAAGSTPPGESSGQGATPPKSAPENP
ncbi:hypothetical protein [Methylacidimicrobium tartarophylax]|uniref:hypothetical protein n=1 Tax=Methylacidimicrobium tartarophylax TaxID=1041768 RepID=UPI001156DD6A|nr:hypothetical protein [Methylacidimicrobium tartarophylax]